MEKEQFEQYEYARKRLMQKKHLNYHFVVCALGCLFAYIANHFFHMGDPYQWYKWLICIWLFILILHFFKVHISNRFMNKNWERQQIERLVSKQQNRLRELESKHGSDTKN
jgi:hypothetical protein